MSKSNALETAILGLLFNGTAIADLAENDASSPAANLYVSLHTADPGEAGTQATNETTYGSYARVAVARTGAGWVVSGNQVTPDDPVIFPAPASGTGTITHAGIGTASSGAGFLLYSGAISPTITIAVGIAPTLSTASVVTED